MEILERKEFEKSLSHQMSIDDVKADSFGMANKNTPEVKEFIEANKDKTDEEFVKLFMDKYGPILTYFTQRNNSRRIKTITTIAIVFLILNIITIIIAILPLLKAANAHPY